MITRISARSEAPAKSPPPIAETRTEILGMIRRLEARRRTRPFPSNAPSAAQSGLALVLQNIEARLTRIEETMSRRRSIAAPAKGGPPDDAMFFGLIKGQMLSDMLQLVTSNGLSGVFVIENDLSKCTLYFDEGKICHAENGNMTGEDAFFAAFGAQSGTYHFTESVDMPAERTVSVGTQYLVLEALRRMDESHAT